MSDDGKKRNIHAGHRERMRQRFLKNGLDGFEPHEILEFLLFLTYKRGNTNPIGHALIREFGSIRGVLDADYRALRRVVGSTSATMICFLRQLYKEYEHESTDGKPYSMRETEARLHFFSAELSCEKYEVMLVVCLDDQLCVSSVVRLADGSSGHVSFDIQRLMRIVLESGCSCVMLAHNHPKGKAVASYEDIVNTRHICDAFGRIGIRLVDHIIVGDGRAISMKGSGAFPE